MGFTRLLALKSVSWGFRAIQFCCAAIILGIFSYFLAVLSDHNLPIPTYVRAVEGISGAAALYTLLALIFVCCIGGIAVFSVLGIILDLAFTGAFIYLAYATRDGRSSCNGNVTTPLGSGNTNTDNTVPNGSGGNTILPSLGTACRLNSACFAVSLVGLFFFLFSTFIEYALLRQRRREKAFGPSPNNNYTSGPPKRSFWRRKTKRGSTYAGGSLEEQKPDALPKHTTPDDIRPSYATDTTAVGNEPVQQKYGPAAPIGQQDTYPGRIGQNQASYTAQPTTHTAYANTYSQYANQPTTNAAYTNQPTYAGYKIQPGTHITHPPYEAAGQTAEMPAEEVFVRTGDHQTYNTPRTGTF